MANSARVVIGWREWVALPDLGLPAIKAKVDTGARTSALHAIGIETFKRGGKLFARFRIRPLKNRPSITVVCEAPVVDRRIVTDSSGHSERRYVIESHLKIGTMLIKSEITLANRRNMSHRMLIGRSAMRHVVIDPTNIFLLGRPEKIAGQYKRTERKRSVKNRGKA